jgi:hypothetical protein
MTRIRRGAVVARARYPFAAGAAQLVVEGRIGVVLAHPSDAEANGAIVLHRLKPNADANGTLQRPCSDGLEMIYLFRRLKTGRLEPTLDVSGRVGLLRFSF